MARIAGVDLPRNKHVDIALTYIYGIGNSRSRRILSTANVEPMKKVHDLNEEEVNRIRDTKVSDTELADAKLYLTGSQLLAYATNAGIAGQLLAIERYDLGFLGLEFEILHRAKGGRTSAAPVGK